MTPAQEQQVYKLLELLNSALKSNSVTKKEVRSTADARGNPTASQKAGKEAKGAYLAVASTLGATNKLLQGLNANLDSVNSGAGNVSKSFTVLNSELNTFLGTIKGFSLPKLDEVGGVSIPKFDDAGIISAINNTGKTIVDGIRIPSFTLDDTRIVDAIGKIRFDDTNLISAIYGATGGYIGPTTTFDDSKIVKAINDIKFPTIDTTSIAEALKSASISTVFNDAGIIKQLDTNKTSNEQTLNVVHKAIVSSIRDNSRNIIDAINKNNAASMTQTATLIQTLQNQNSTSPLTTPATQSTTTAPPPPPPPSTPPQNTTQQQAASNATQNLTSSTTSATTAAKYHGMTLKQIAGSMIQSKALEINAIDGVAMAANGLKTVVNELTKQFVALANVGMGSMGNLYDLNVAALKSGMSMEKYQKLFVGNMELAARTMSIDNFDALTSANNGLLARMGVFGEDAKELQVEIAQTATTLGVSQAEIPDAANSLVRTFRRLNKTISMSSQEFLESVKAIRDNNHSVNEMSGLTEGQRPARLAELVQIQNHGRSLGLSAVESDKLGKALMEQRYASVKERYKEAGSLQQMGAILGMSADGNRAGELSRKRNKSEAETSEFAEILSRMNVEMNRQVENSDNVGVENQRDVIYEHLSASTKEIMMGGTRAMTANESAALNQEAFGKSVGDFGMAVGTLVKYATGLKENGLASGMLGVIGGVALTVFAKPLQALLGKIWEFGQKLVTPKNFVGPPKPGYLAMGGSPPPPPTTPPPPPPSNNSWFSKITDPIKNGLTAVKNMLSTSIPGFAKIGSVAGSVASSVGSSLKTVAGLLTRIPFLGQVLAMGIELFTGDLRDAMSPTGSLINTIGSMILNIPMSIANFFLNGFEWIFGENLLKPVRTVMELLAAGFMTAVNGAWAGIINTISWFTDFLPEDSGLRKSMDAYAKQTSKVLDENVATTNKIMDSQSTLAQISEKNKKTIEGTAAANEKSADANTKSADKVARATSDFNNTQYDSIITKARVISDAKNLIGSTETKVTPATPEPQVAKTVSNTTEANKPKEQNVDGAPKVNSVSSEDAKLLESGDSLSILKKILDTLKQILLAEQMQTGGAPGSFNDILNRTPFTSSTATSDDTTQRLLSRQ